MSSILSGISPVLRPAGAAPLPTASIPAAVSSHPDTGPEFPAGSREIGDVAATRAAIFNNVLREAQSLPPLENARHRLELADVGYTGPERYSIADRKQAILENRTLARKLQGTWVLRDQNTGEEVERRRTTLAHVPYLTDGGTFVNRGREYTVANQLRLRPGTYARLKSNGEYEVHANVLPGKGVAHRYLLDPAKGQFSLQVGQAKIPLMPLLRALGAQDKQIIEAWGPDLYQQNSAKDSTVELNKLLDRFVRHSGRENMTLQERQQKLRELFESTELDPDVMEATLKKRYDRLGLDTVLDATKKLLAISRGEDDVDDRDNIAYQTVFGPEELFAERLAKDYGGYRRGAFHKASWAGSLRGMGPGLLSRQLESVLTKSGLGQALEEINPADVLDKNYRVTRMGEGGISGTESIPAESRDVQESHLGFIDLLRTPETFRAGVDLFFSSAARKGADGQIYAPFQDNKTGKQVWKSPREISKLSVAFPKSQIPGTNLTPVMKAGRIRFVPSEQVDLTIRHFEKAFSPLGNMIPMKSAVKGQRVAMGSRMLSQAMPVRNAEAPLVQSGVPDEPGMSYEEKYGERMGALRAKEPAKVMAVDENGIRLRYADGREETKELYRTFPYNFKSFLHQTPAVQPGQIVQPGQLLARSNATDAKGVTALGKNARVAYLPFRGLNHEDAVVVSQSFADRMTSEHLYKHRVDYSKDHKQTKADFVSLFPGKYTREQLAKIGEDGVIRPGEKVNEGDPIILAATPNKPGHHKVLKLKSRSFDDASLTWGHHHEGEVTDISRTDKGATALVRSYMPLQLGDKLSGRVGDKGIVAALIPDNEMPHDKDGQPYELLLNPLGVVTRCYDEQTEFLVDRGWVYGRDIRPEDKFVCYHVWSEGLFVLDQLAPFHVADYRGKMLKFENTRMDFCVTPNHRMWAACGYPGAPWQEVTAERIAGRKGWKVPVAGNPVPGLDEDFVLPHMEFSVKATKADKRDIVISAEDWAEFLGWYMAEGNTDDKVHISQSDTANPENYRKISELLDRLPFAWNYNPKNTQFHITSARLCRVMAPFGLSDKKHLPDWLFRQSPQTRDRFLLGYFAGDGTKDKSHRPRDYNSVCSMSQQLASDIQRLLIYQGVSANTAQQASGIWRTGFHIKRHRLLEKRNWREVDYDGKIYCPTVPTGYVVTRRNGKILIAGNTNPMQVHEAVLGKIATKRGEPYRVPDFEDIEDLADYVSKEAQKHDVQDLEDVYDPETKRKIPKILTGNRFFMKLHHLAEQKEQGRGLGGYSQDESPAKGGSHGSKRVSGLDSNAILAHGAYAVLRDARTTRGQRNEDYWMAFMEGYDPQITKVPLVYQKFVNELRGAGVNVVSDGPKLHIMAMTNKDVESLAGNRRITRGDTVRLDKGLEPIAGGLFDPKLTGGHYGDKFAYIQLSEPMPNPVMEDPIRHMLGLTQKDLREVIAGRKEVNGETGPEGVRKALESINVKREMAKARLEISGNRKTKRDEAIRKLGYLKAADKLGIHPKEWLLDRVPVLPPKFRPISLMEDTGTPLVADPNYLYKELLDADDLLKGLKKEVEDVGDERLAVYDAFKAVTGLGDPVSPQLREKRVQGILKSVLGSSPKFGSVQRRLLSSPVDLVGRAVISPDPDLDMDHVGLPEGRAWDVYRIPIVRRLRRKGLSMVEAMRHAEERTPEAKRELLAEMEYRPVFINRAPVLHKFGVMAAWPVLAKGNTLRVSPAVLKGFGADFDGDQMNYHVPLDEDVRKEMIERMLPSKNLLNPQDFKSPMNAPGQEYLGGLYEATRDADKTQTPRYYENLRAAAKAYMRGEININTLVRIADK